MVLWDGIHNCHCGGVYNVHNTGFDFQEVFKIQKLWWKELDNFRNSFNITFIRLKTVTQEKNTVTMVLVNFDVIEMLAFLLKKCDCLRIYICL